MASETRLRKQTQPANGHTNRSIIEERQASPASSHAEDDEDADDEKITVVDILRMIVGLLMLNCLMSYLITNDSVLWGWRPWFVRPKLVARWLQGPILLTDSELARYDGTDTELPVYLALNGTIYDVSAGSRIYGPGGSYNVFAGKDAARGFITGCFAEDSTPDLRGAEWTYVPTDVHDGGHLSGVQKTRREQELRKARERVRETLEGWQKTFRGESGRDYFEVGKVVRQEGWLEKLPMRKLCEPAEKGRPKPKTKAKDKGEQYRGS